VGFVSAGLGIRLLNRKSSLTRLGIELSSVSDVCRQVPTRADYREPAPARPIAAGENRTVRCPPLAAIYIHRVDHQLIVEIERRVGLRGEREPLRVQLFGFGEHANSPDVEIICRSRWHSAPPPRRHPLQNRRLLRKHADPVLAAQLGGGPARVRARPAA
jgi:hypothetical protein